VVRYCSGNIIVTFNCFGKLQELPKIFKRSSKDLQKNFPGFLLYHNAADAGRKVIAVNPAYTSQDCSGCGNRKKRGCQREYTIVRNAE
jgi:hypothetical protein